MLLGGVLASQHRIPLAAAIAGAVGGDAIGYAVGKRWGRGLLHGTLGRLVKDQHLQRGERYLAERGGKAVFFGRFTAALRVVVPGLAGMAGMPYRTFAVYNIIGGAAWASETTLVGYLAGASWRRAEHLASRIGLLLLVLLLLGIGVSVLARALRRRTYSLQAIGDRLATTRPATWARRRFPCQAAWLGRRIDPASPGGLSLTVTLALAAIGAWTFAGITQDVLAGEEAARLDPAPKPSLWPTAPAGLPPSCRPSPGSVPASCSSPCYRREP